MTISYYDMKRLLLGLQVRPESLKDYRKLVGALTEDEDLNRSDLVNNFCRRKIKSIMQEEFHVITLNNYLEVIRDNLIFRGAQNLTVANPSEIFRTAIIQSATSIIVWHTHPFKNYNPSAADDSMTEVLVNCGKLLNISVVDSLIIPVQSPLFYSYAKENRIVCDCKNEKQ